MAISSVLEICEHYNRSKVFEAIGFGAKIPPHGNVSHLFPLNLMGFERSVQGVAGVLGSYKTALRSTTLYGPTNFSPTIDDYAYKCRNFPKDASRYQILLIASDLPLSIIIIGVGNEEFEKMDELDSDESLLTHNGRTAQRDIVQFVPFRLFMGAVPSAYNTGQISKPADQAYVQSLLAKEVLAEVPDQVTSYFKLKGIAPLQLHNQAQAYPQPGQGPGYPQSQQQSNVQMYPNAQPPYPLQHQSPAQTGQVGVDDINFRMQQNLSLNSSAPPQEPYSMS
ncbi:copine domain-containing protein [Ditylenchus destructor]|nr:copine domain-containing protein [Ditylenchus destructor]